MALRNYTNQRPTGSDSATDFFVRGQRRSNLELQFFNSTDIYFECTTRGVRAYLNRRTYPGAGGINWQTPNKELDPSVAVPINTLVYISPQNPLVTDGLTDAGTNVLMQAMAGVWISVQSVPAQAVVDGVTVYNMPQVLEQGEVTGSPLKGDADNADVFWIPIAGVMACG